MSYYDVELGLSRLGGHHMVHKFGQNLAIPNGAWRFVNLLSFTGWPLSAATTVRVKAGGDAADTAAGDGAREITVQGIDGSGAEVSEAIATAGASASSATTASFIRVHRAWVSAVGVYGAANTAAVTVENSAGGTDLIRIGAGQGQTLFGGYTIPTGKTGLLWTIHAHVDSGKTADIAVYTRENVLDTTAPMSSKRIKLLFDGVIGTLVYRPRTPGLVIPALSDIWVEAYGDGAITQVSVEFELQLIDS